MSEHARRFSFPSQTSNTVIHHNLAEQLEEFYPLVANINWETWMAQYKGELTDEDITGKNPRWLHLDTRGLHIVNEEGTHLGKHVVERVFVPPRMMKDLFGRMGVQASNDMFLWRGKPLREQRVLISGPASGPEYEMISKTGPEIQWRIGTAPLKILFPSPAHEFPELAPTELQGPYAAIFAFGRHESGVRQQYFNLLSPQGILFVSDPKHSGKIDAYEKQRPTRPILVPELPKNRTVEVNPVYLERFGEDTKDILSSYTPSTLAMPQGKGVPHLRETVLGAHQLATVLREMEVYRNKNEEWTKNSFPYSTDGMHILVWGRESGVGLDGLLTVVGDQGRVDYVSVHEWIVRDLIKQHSVHPEKFSSHTSLEKLDEKRKRRHEDRPYDAVILLGRRARQLAYFRAEDKGTFTHLIDENTKIIDFTTQF